MAKSALFSVRKNEPCPQCGAELVIRSGKHGPFLGCSRYPECDYVRPLKSQADGHIVKILEGQLCPECGAVLVLRQGALACSSDAVSIRNVNIQWLLINRMKRRLPVQPASKDIWSSAVLVTVKSFIPAIATRNVSLSLTSHRLQGNAPSAIIRYSSKENRAGREALCASKQCGKPVPVE